MKRIASVIAVASSDMETYERLHREVWPGVLERLSLSNIRNYSIYRYGELLFSYMEYVGEDYDADMALIAADPVTQRWWEFTAPLQISLREHESDPWWRTMLEVFHSE